MHCLLSLCCVFLLATPDADACLHGTGEIEGILVLTPRFSTTADGPEFAVEFTNISQSLVRLPLLRARSGIILDGVDLTPTVYWGHGLEAAVQPGETFTYRLSLRTYLQGSERAGFSERLGRWRWQIPLETDPHLIQFYLREPAKSCSDRAMSNQVAFFWDGSDPLLFE